MKTQHTPGPWFVDYGNGQDKHKVYGICTVQKYSDDSHDDGLNHKIIVETDGGCYPPEPSDAHLIAAAPELLAELVKITDSYAQAMKDAGVTHYPEALVVVRQARAAIAKATGGAK